ncbi:MAG: CapA family protein, partial [Victivallaceae bacterium]
MNIAKLTFTGDIMAGMDIDRQCRCNNNSFDYSTYLENCSKLFMNSDFVVGNLETPLAGAVQGYSAATYCFNTP